MTSELDEFIAEMRRVNKEEKERLAAGGELPPEVRRWIDSLTPEERQSYDVGDYV